MTAVCCDDAEVDGEEDVSSPGTTSLVAAPEADEAFHCEEDDGGRRRSVNMWENAGSGAFFHTHLDLRHMDPLCTSTPLWNRLTHPPLKQTRAESALISPFGIPASPEHTDTAAVLLSAAAEWKSLRGGVGGCSFCCHHNFQRSQTRKIQMRRSFIKVRKIMNSQNVEQKGFLYQAVTA